MCHIKAIGAKPIIVAHTQKFCDLHDRYSLRRSKQLSLRVAVVPVEAFEAAQLAARHAMEAAVWAALATEVRDPFVYLCHTLRCVAPF